MLRGPLPWQFEFAVRTFLTFSTYQAERPFFRQGIPVRFQPVGLDLGVTMVAVGRERVVEVGLFGTDSACRAMAETLTGLSSLTLSDCADALGEQMNLLAGRMAFHTLQHPRCPVQLGLPNTYLAEQCQTYTTQVIPLVGQQIGCEGVPGSVWLVVSERTPYYLIGEALALLRQGMNRFVCSSVLALLDEFLELDDQEDRNQLEHVNYCRRELIKTINGESSVSRVTEMLERLESSRAPLESRIPTSHDVDRVKLEVEGDDLELVLEFISEGHEAVDAVDGIMMLAERNGVAQGQVDQLFRVFHSLKGVAGMVGVESVTRIAHGTETLLADVRDRGRRFDKQLIDFVFASSTLIRRQIELANEAAHHDGMMEVVPGFAQHARGLEALHAGEDVGCIDTSSLISAGEGTDRSETKSETVRVDVETLERMTALLRGLTLVKAQLACDDDSGLENLTRVQDRLIQLANEMSLISCQSVLNRASRLVRELSRTLGKMVQVSFEGEEYRVSRKLIEALSDPIIHVLRNSLDHGIETPDERRLTDKPALATVFVRVDFEEDCLKLEIGDDGRGINGDKVLKVARERGLIALDAELDWSDKCALIFSPGFSTADQVSDVSGRGVGLDVVKQRIDALGGQMEVISELGVGTTFVFKVPMNFAENASFSDSLEVLLLEDKMEEKELRAGEVGWF